MINNKTRMPFSNLYFLLLHDVMIVQKYIKFAFYRKFCCPTNENFMDTYRKGCEIDRCFAVSSEVDFSILI